MISKRNRNIRIPNLIYPKRKKIGNKSECDSNIFFWNQSTYTGIKVEEMGRGGGGVEFFVQFPIRQFVKGEELV